MPDPDRVREALERWDNSGFRSDDGTVYADVSEFEAVAVAARAWLEGTEIRWCEEHNSDGVPRLSAPPFTCWKAEFTRHLDPSDCRIVSRRLVGGE